MLTPSIKDENRKEELKRKQENPNDFGPGRSKGLQNLKEERARKAAEAKKI